MRKLIGLLPFLLMISNVSTTSLPNPAQDCQITSGNNFIPYTPVVKYDTQHPPTVSSDIGGAAVILNAIMQCTGLTPGSEAYVRLSADPATFYSGAIGTLISNINSLGVELSLAAQPQINVAGKPNATTCPNLGKLAQGKLTECRVAAGSDGSVIIPFSITVNYNQYLPAPLDTSHPQNQPITIPGVHLDYGSDNAHQTAAFLSAGDVLGITLQAGVSTCELRPSSKQITVTLPDMNINQFHGVGSTLGETAFTIILDKCHVESGF